MHLYALYNWLAYQSQYMMQTVIGTVAVHALLHSESSLRAFDS